MAFQEYAYRRMGHTGGIGISIHSGGTIMLSRGAKDKYFDLAFGVGMYFDREARQIGIKPLNEPTHRCYKLCAYGAAKQPQLIAAVGFTKFYDLVPAKATRYDAEWSDEHGMLIVQLPVENES